MSWSVAGTEHPENSAGSWEHRGTGGVSDRQDFQSGWHIPNRKQHLKHSRAQLGTAAMLASAVASLPVPGATDVLLDEGLGARL